MADAFNRLALETAIMDAKGDARLLEMAVEQVLSVKESDAVHELFKLRPSDGSRFFCLHDAEINVLHHAVNRVQASIREAETIFYEGVDGKAPEKA